MKLFRKLIACIALIALFSVSAGGALALDIESPEQPLPNYLPFTGIVKEINPYVDSQGKAIDGLQFVLTEAEEGGLVNFRVTSDTYYVTDKELYVGAAITGFYDAKAPQILIYPAQPEAKVLAVDLPEGQNIKVDTFKEDIVSVDNQLKLNISNETKVVLQSGEAYTGELAGKNLVVLYTVSTRSIPAQTSPLSVTVLENMDILVDGMGIQSPATHIKADGTIMVPVRAIAEALGYEVGWDYNARTITLNDEISFILNEDSYVNSEKSAIVLGIAPELVNETCYVPLSFFEKVADTKQAATSEGKIVINKDDAK